MSYSSKKFGAAYANTVGMRYSRLLMALAAALVIAPASAHAQVLGKFQWAGIGNAFPWWYKQQNNQAIDVYAGGSYRAKYEINSSAPYLPPHGTTAFGPAVDIFCVDFTHEANTGTYNAWFTKLNQPLTHTRSSNLSDYLKAAWLVQKMDATPVSNKSTRADIHGAIWYMMSGEPAGVLHGSNYTNTGILGWIGLANLDYNDGSVNASQWNIVTDQCVTTIGHNGAGFGSSSADNCSQEFLTRNVTPEPATLILLGTGLAATLLLTGVLRRQSA